MAIPPMLSRRSIRKVSRGPSPALVKKEAGWSRPPTGGEGREAFGPGPLKSPAGQYFGYGFGYSSSFPHAKGCDVIGNFNRLIIESMDIPQMDPDAPDALPLISARVTGVSGPPPSGSLLQCIFLPAHNDSTIAVTASSSYEPPLLDISPLNLSVGDWRLNCVFKALPETSADDLSISSRSVISVVDSRALKIKGVKGNSNGSDLEYLVPGSEVYITLREPVWLTEARPYLRYQRDLPIFVVLPKKGVTFGDVFMRLPTMLPVGPVEVGLALTEQALMATTSGKLDLPTKKYWIPGVQPRALQATLSYGLLVVEFDVNIKLQSSCNSVFDHSNLFGEGMSCEARTSQLWFLLGARTEIVNGTTISFSNPSGVVQEWADPPHAPDAEGSIVAVWMQEGMVKFSLSGDCKVRNDSTAKVWVTVLGVDGNPGLTAAPEQFQAVWNVTYLKDNRTWSTREVLQAWNSTRLIQEEFDSSPDNLAVEFSGKLLLPGVEYLLVVFLVGPSDQISGSESITMELATEEDRPIVSIRGPTKIYADRSYPYRAEVFGQLPEGVEMQYLWRVSGRTFASPGAEDSVILSANTLKGGRIYELSLSIIANEDKLLTSSAIKVETLRRREIQVVLDVERLRVGFTSSVVIDASKSYSIDDPSKKLGFRWGCRTIGGEACFHIKREGSPIRFENFLSEETLTSPLLVFEASVLDPNAYIFTVVVNQGGANESATAHVEIVRGDHPLLLVQKPSSPVDITQQVVIEGFVTSHRDVTVWWESVYEPGFSFAPLQQVVPGMLPRKMNGPRRAPCSLVIPSPRLQLGWDGLEIASRYKFRLSASSGHQTSVMEVVLETHSPPKYGRLIVTPSSGEALATKFSFKTSEWRDRLTDFPLVAHFGFHFSDQPSSQTTWLGSSSGPDLSFETTLFSNSPSSVTVLTRVKICDTTLSCTDTYGNNLTVTLPESLPEDTLLTMAVNIGDMLRDNFKLTEALSEAENLLSTLDAMGAHAEIEALMLTLQAQMTNKADELQQLIAYSGSEESMGMAVSFLQGALEINDQAPLTADTVDQLGRLNNALLNWVASREPTLNPVEPSSNEAESNSMIYFPHTDQDLRYARKAHRRSKRSLPEYNAALADSVWPKEEPATYKALGVQEVQTMLKISELEVQEAPTQAEKAFKMDKLVQDVSTYLGGLCVGTTMDTSVFVPGSLVALNVQKASLSALPQGMNSVADTDADPVDFVTSGAYVDWDKVLKTYKEEICTQDQQKQLGDGTGCKGVCLGTVLYHELFSSPITRGRAGRNITGNMLRTALMNSSNGVQVHLTDESKRPKISYLWTRSNFSKGIPGFHMRCHGWHDEEWVTSICERGATPPDTDRFQCLCDGPGYAGIFLARSSEKTQETTTTRSPPITHSYSISFIISGNYDEIVGNKEETFEQHLTAEMAQIFKIPESSICNLTISRGSVVVTFHLVESSLTRRHGEQSLVTEAYDIMTELLEGDGFIVKGLNNEELRAHKRPSATSQELSSNHLPILIGGIVGAVLLIGFVLVILAIYLNQKKRMDKVTMIHDTKPPTYRDIHFKDTLDNSWLSQVKKEQLQRKQDTGKNAYLNSYINHGHGDNDVSDEEDVYIKRRVGKSARSNGTDSGFDPEEDVPDAYRYQSPTQEQIDASPVPEHIIKKLEERQQRKIPGTPDDINEEH